MHVRQELPLLVFNAVTWDHSREAPSCPHTVVDVFHKLTAIPDHGIVKQSGADLIKHLLTVPLQVEGVCALPQVAVQGSLEIHDIRDSRVLRACRIVDTCCLTTDRDRITERNESTTTENSSLFFSSSASESSLTSSNASRVSSLAWL